MVVNDVWLTESIGYREMRDPEAKRFRVQGSVDPMVPKAPIAAMTRERLYEDAEQATDQESEQSDEDLDERQSTQAPPGQEFKIIVNGPKHGRRDALDEIMHEMKDTQGLLDRKSVV